MVMLLACCVLAVKTDSWVGFSRSRASRVHAIEAAPVFDSGIVVIGRDPTNGELDSLAEALKAPERQVAPAIRRYLGKFPQSPYNASLNLGYGLEMSREGSFTRSEPFFEQAFHQAE